MIAQYAIVNTTTNGLLNGSNEHPTLGMNDVGVELENVAFKRELGVVMAAVVMEMLLVVLRIREELVGLIFWFVFCWKIGGKVR